MGKGRERWGSGGGEGLAPPGGELAQHLIARALQAHAPVFDQHQAVGRFDQATAVGDDHHRLA